MSRMLRRRIAITGADDGVALAAVIGLMAVGMVLTGVIATSVITGLAQTSSTRADVQSQSSAEAGVAAARAAIANGVCVGAAGSAFSGTSPTYTATVYRPRAEGANPASASDWVPGCPLRPTSADKVRIVSVGSAAARGVGGVTAGDVSTIEVVLSGVVTTITPGTPAVPGTPATTGVSLSPTGAAIYAHSSAGFGGSGALSSVAGSVPNVVIKNGDVTCIGDSSGVTDWIVGSGNITLGDSCKADGNIYASGRATFTGIATIAGNVVSKGVTFGGSSSVTGSVWSTSDVQMPGLSTVQGTMTASALTMIHNARIMKNAWVYGATSLGSETRVQGNLTTKTLTGAGNPASYGSLTRVSGGPAASPYATPTVPTAPNWVDFPSSAPWPGFTTKTISGDCGFATLVATAAQLGANPSVIDARGCTNGFVLGGDNALTLPGDTVIIAKRIDLGYGASISGGSSKRLWLVIPDDKADAQPTCPTGGSFYLGGFFSVTHTTMIYSPCRVNLGSSTELRGQIYAGTATINGASRLAYIQLGLPGYDLGTGAANTSVPTPGTTGTPAAPPVTTYTPRAIEIYRTIQNSSKQNGSGG